MRKTIVRVTIASLIMFSALLGGYYVLFLAPRLKLPSAYHKAQTILLRHRTPLQENRAALIRLPDILPLTPEKLDAMHERLTTIRNTNLEALSAADEAAVIPTVSGAPSTIVSFLGSELAPAFPDLQKEQRTILTEQQDVLAGFIALFQASSPVISYIPSVTPDADPSTFQSLIADDIAHLNDILKPLQEAGHAHDIDVSNIISSTRVVQSHLQALTGPDDDLSALRNAWQSLRQRANQTLRDHLFSATSVSLLTRQTNLLKEYDFWLTKLRNRQAKLGNHKS